MKLSDSPKISKKWWNSEKPGDIKGAELEKALAGAEKALENAKKKGDGPSIEAAVGACKSLEGAVEKTIKKECDKKTHKDVIEVLEKYFPLIKDEASRLKQLLDQASKSGAESDDEEESDDKIFQKDYLYKMLKLLSSGKELKFGFGLNTKAPEASVLLLKRKGKPEMLFKALKKQGDFTNRLITYGYALPDSEDGKTLVFRLEQGASDPPQIIKLGRCWLRADKSLRFRRLKVILPTGQTLEDNQPETEDEEEGQVAEGGSAGTSADTSGRRRLSDEERAHIRREIEQIERRLDEVSAKEPATV